MPLMFRRGTERKVFSIMRPRGRGRSVIWPEAEFGRFLRILKRFWVKRDQARAMQRDHVVPAASKQHKLQPHPALPWELNTSKPKFQPSRNQDEQKNRTSTQFDTPSDEPNRQTLLKSIFSFSSLNFQRLKGSRA